MVDWSTGCDVSMDSYLQFWTVYRIYRQSSQNTRIVARQLYLLLQQLQHEFGLQCSDVHLIGHSLGAHIAGLAAEHMWCEIGRITGETFWF